MMKAELIQKEQLELSQYELGQTDKIIAMDKMIPYTSFLKLSNTNVKAYVLLHYENEYGEEKIQEEWKISHSKLSSYRYNYGISVNGFNRKNSKKQNSEIVIPKSNIPDYIEIPRSNIESGAVPEPAKPIQIESEPKSLQLSIVLTAIDNMKKQIISSLEFINISNKESNQSVESAIDDIADKITMNNNNVNIEAIQYISTGIDEIQLAMTSILETISNLPKPEPLPVIQENENEDNFKSTIRFRGTMSTEEIQDRITNIAITLLPDRKFKVIFSLNELEENQ